MLEFTKTAHYNKIPQPKTILPNYYLLVASVDSSMTKSTCIFLKHFSKHINACVENTNKTE